MPRGTVRKKSGGVSKVCRGIVSKPVHWFSYFVSLQGSVTAAARDAREMPASIGLDEGNLTDQLNDGTADANFADKFVGDEAVRRISDALASNCSKTRVFLDRNCVGADGAAALGDMLKVRNRNSSRKTLVVS